MSGAPAAPKSFRHGIKVGAALLPNLLLVAEIGGKVAVGMLLVSSATCPPAQISASDLFMFSLQDVLLHGLHVMQLGTMTFHAVRSVQKAVLHPEHAMRYTCLWIIDVRAQHTLSSSICSFTLTALAKVEKVDAHQCIMLDISEECLPVGQELM